MSDDVGDIAAYYGKVFEQEHTRLERHQLEYDLTWRYLDAYLPPQGTILEIGAATGRYTVELARRGYEVTAVDLSPVMLEKCRENLAAAGLEKRVRLIQADARDLAALPQTDFDAALLMGPLYHLVLEADRKMALGEAVHRLRDGGVLFSAFISRFAVFADMLKNHPEWIWDQPDVQTVLKEGKDPEDHPRGGFRGYFVKPSEVAPLHEALGLNTLVLAAVEPAISADDACYNALEGEQRQRWLDLLFAISAETSILGASRHLLYIGRKG